jgi:hypothetical protein
MREGDDSNDTDFEAHRHASRSAMSAERRAFLKSGFAATSGAVALATARISFLPPTLPEARRLARATAAFPPMSRRHTGAVSYLLA